MSTNNDILKIRFVSQKPKEGILQSVFAIGKSAKGYNFECEFETFFAEVYEMAVELYKKFRDVYPQGSYVDVLGEELNHSMALYCKCSGVNKATVKEIID